LISSVTIGFSRRTLQPGVIYINGMFPKLCNKHAPSMCYSIHYVCIKTQ